MTAAPGKRDELIEALGTHFPNVEEEAGTVIYAMHADNDDADVIWFYELYTDQDAFAAHSGSPGMKELGGKLAGLVLEVVRHRSVLQKRLGRIGLGTVGFGAGAGRLSLVIARWRAGSACAAAVTRAAAGGASVLIGLPAGRRR